MFIPSVNNAIKQKDSIKGELSSLRMVAVACRMDTSNFEDGLRPVAGHPITVCLHLQNPSQ